MYNEKSGCKQAGTLIIGGGLGGLLTGAILARNGRHITVLEKNRNVGGGLHTFRRGDMFYATGMHVFGGFNDGNIMSRICRYLGIDDRLHLSPTDANCIDEIFAPDGHYLIPRGRDNYVSYLSALFPDEAEGIRQYVNALYKLADDEISHFHTSASTVSISDEQFLWSADDFIAHYVTNPRLRALLSYLAPLYAGIKSETPAYVHAIVNASHIEGSSMFAHGSQQMADLLAGIITHAGGEIMTGQEVVKVEVSDRRAMAVQTSAGHRVEFDTLVSAIDPRRLVCMVTPGAFPPSFCNRINEAPYSYSAFKLFIRLKDGVAPHVAHPRYFFHDSRDAWNADSVSMQDWPRCAMAITSPASDGSAATMTVVAPITYDWFEQWQESRVGHRPEGYYLLKKSLEQKLFALLNDYIPELDNSVQEMFSSTPLTIRDYNGIYRGSMYGFRKDCNHIMYTKLSVNTKVPNLFLTGQSVNLHGMCGVAITSVMTAQSILGKEVVV